MHFFGLLGANTQPWVTAFHPGLWLLGVFPSRWQSIFPVAKLARNVNALSLDAVAVSLLWQFIFCISFAERAPAIAESVSLGITVWLIYCADRLLDAARIDPSFKATYRHRFHLRHRRGLTIIWMVLLVADAVVVCLGIDASLQMLGIGLAAGVLVYGAGIHFAATPLRRIPKELQVGFLFSCGVSLASWPSVLAAPPTQLPMLMTLGIASLLFACNCIFVAACELETDRVQGFDSLPGRLLDRDQSLPDQSLPDQLPLHQSLAGRTLILSMIGLAIASLILATFEIIPWVAGVTLAISFAFLSGTSLAQFSGQFSGDHTFNGRMTAGFVADSALFVPPLLCLLWLN